MISCIILESLDEAWAKNRAVLTPTTCSPPSALKNLLSLVPQTSSSPESSAAESASLSLEIYNKFKFPPKSVRSKSLGLVTPGFSQTLQLCLFVLSSCPSLESCPQWPDCVPLHHLQDCAVTVTMNVCSACDSQMLPQRKQ